jgi:hypothetical protein
MESIVPDSSSLKTPPSEPWFSEEDLALNDLDESNETLNGQVTKVDPFSVVKHSFDQTSDILAEECSHLLRKAQTAISKAYKLP